jgi:VWFA-related protein
MHITTRLGLLLLAPVFLTSMVPAQQPLAHHGDPGTDANKIYLDVVVAPKNGKPVAGLQEQDFKLLDNKTSRPLTSFRAVAGNEPISVILMIDSVNATFSQVSYEREQLDGFLKANGGHLAYPTTMAFFNDTGTEIQKDFTRDGNALSEALAEYTQSLRTIRRNTGIFGAEDRLSLSLTTLKQLTAVEGARPGRKLVLWISPGWPLLSGPGIVLDSKQETQIFSDVVAFSTQLRRAHITLYAVDPLGAAQSVQSVFYYQTYLKGVRKPSDVSIANVGLQVLAVQSGGLALGSNNDTASLLKQCVEDGAAYYELSFDPPPAEHGDEYHSIDVQVGKPGLIARTRTGYYSQP